MILANAVWEELKRAKVTVEYITIFSDRHRKYTRRYNIFIYVVSVIGIGAWKYIDDSPFIAVIVVIISLLLKPAIPNIIMSESQLSRLDVLFVEYTKYFINIEKLYHKGVEEDDLELFMSMRENIAVYDTELNKILRENGSIYTKSQELKTQYINKIYRDQYERSTQEG